LSNKNFHFRAGLLPALGLCLCLAALPASADVQRCVSPTGVVSYTDQGCPAPPAGQHGGGNSAGEVLLPSPPLMSRPAIGPGGPIPAGTIAPPAGEIPVSNVK
jgi:hypothetical protein